METRGIDKLQIVEEFLTRKLWLQDFGEGIRLVGATLRVEPSGYLLVLKGVTAEGPVVAFVGGADLTKVMRGVMTKVTNGPMKWRQDVYRIANLDKN